MTTKETVTLDAEHYALLMGLARACAAVATTPTMRARQLDTIDQEAVRRNPANEPIERRKAVEALTALRLHDNTGAPEDVGYMSALADVAEELGLTSEVQATTKEQL